MVGALDEQRAALDDGLPLAGDSSGSDAPEENFDDENASVQDDAEVDGWLSRPKTSQVAKGFGAFFPPGEGGKADMSKRIPKVLIS